MDAPHFIICTGAAKDSLLAILEGRGHIMGRHESSAYRINDPRCSRFHCEVRRAGDRVTVHDQGGAGGTQVNGQRVTEQVLRHGDTLKVGDTVLLFQAGSVSDADTLNEFVLRLPGPKEAAQLAALAGTTLAHYDIDAILGQGQSGMVFQATDTSDGKLVALKVLQPALARDDEERDRFVQTMTRVVPLQHPNLVRVFAVGKSGRYCWTALELVEGGNLTDVIKRLGVAGMLDWKSALRVAAHVGRALDYAHGRGIIHRAVAPCNILIQDADKLAMLGDLMLANALDGTPGQQVPRPGEPQGDVNYMSPEQIQGQPDYVDGRSDLYSLGATLYGLVTGKPPFASNTRAETITRIVQETPTAPSKVQLGIPSSFEGIIMKLLAKNSAERFAHAAELVEELERIGRFQGVQV